MTHSKLYGPVDHEVAAVLNALLATDVDAIVVIDHCGIIQLVNPAIEKLFGYTPEYLVGKNVSCLMPPPDCDRHDEYISRYLRTGEAKIIGIGREVLCQRCDGSLFAAGLAVSEVKINDKQLFTGILRDMTDRRRAEAALERERQFSNNLLDTANAMVIVLDEQGLIQRVNQFFEVLTGYSQNEVQRQPWIESFIPEEHHQQARDSFGKIIRDEAATIQSLPILLRDGRRRTIAWASRKLVNADEILHGVLAVGNDITELQIAEQRLIQQERLAAIGQMVTGLAHESRNALQRSRACLDMLELDCADAPDQLDLIHRTQYALVELQRLYVEVRNYASPIKLERIDCDLAALCSETWQLLDDQPAAHDVRLEILSDNAHTVCHCDRERMRQVFRNIFENSLAVAPPGSRVLVKCENVWIEETEYVLLRIFDEGPGITADQRANVFEPFYTTKRRGTGLGMPISKRIIELHDGEIWVGDHGPPGAEIALRLRTTNAAKEQD